MGSLPTPSLSMQSLAADGGDTWGEDIGGSKKPVAITANLGSLMMANCYKNPSGKAIKNLIITISSIIGYEHH